MSTSSIETWVWVLIYGGLLLLCLGVFVLRAGAAFGWAMVVVGGVAVLVGAALVVMRSRMQPPTK